MSDFEQAALFSRVVATKFQPLCIQIATYTEISSAGLDFFGFEICCCVIFGLFYLRKICMVEFLLAGIA